MTASTWPIALELVLESEGGFVDRADDAGGPTNFGITQRTYDAYRRGKFQPVQSVKGILEVEVSDIYYSSYWEPYCNRFPKGIDYLCFDFGVNAGPHEANLILQRSLGVKIDGIIGPITREALDRWKDIRTLIEIFTRHRIAFYIELDEPAFERGWKNRADEAELNALKMVGGLA